jgi:hypothetical protein
VVQVEAKTFGTVGVPVLLKAEDPAEETRLAVAATHGAYSAKNQECFIAISYVRKIENPATAIGTFG